MNCIFNNGILLFSSLLLVLVESQPPVTHSITLTVFTEPKTWHEAVSVCETGGGHLMDITYFSLYNTILQKSQESPWKDIPLGNGPPFWLGLHRQTNLLGEEYYSSTCDALSDFRIVYWDSADPYTLPAGPETGQCVYDVIEETQFTNYVTSTHKYSRADCSERHRFICLFESQDHCHFEMVSGYYGDTAADFSPNDDITLPYTTTEDCAERCLSESRLFPHPYLKIDEECWGFSIMSKRCHLHIVVKPTYFDLEPSSRVSFRKGELHIKRCFTTAVNTSSVSVPTNEHSFPNTTCGNLEINSSVLTFPMVTLYVGIFTWNEAFQLCNNSGQILLKIQSEDDTSALEQVVDKYTSHLQVPTLWLGLHEPDPIFRPNTRQWADCEYESFTDWDETPSHNLQDAHLCAVVDASSSFTWKPESCNEQHQVICMGGAETLPTYSNGQRGVIGDGPFLGPIPGSSLDTCEHFCTNSTYMDKECWAYAHLDSPTGACYLFFSEDQTDYQDHVMAANDSFVFYRKMVWAASIQNPVLVAEDTSLFPYSCCESTNCSEETTHGHEHGDGTDGDQSCDNYQSVDYPYTMDIGRCQIVSSSSSSMLTLLPTTTMTTLEQTIATAPDSTIYISITNTIFSSSIQVGSSDQIRPTSTELMGASNYETLSTSTYIPLSPSYTSQTVTQMFDTDADISLTPSIQSSLDFYWSSSADEYLSFSSSDETYNSIEATQTLHQGSPSIKSTSTIVISPSSTLMAAVSSRFPADSVIEEESSSVTASAINEGFKPKAIYLSPCFCRSGSSTKLSLHELQRLLREEHTIHAKNTSRYRRAVTSAWDNRTSSVSIGSTAILLLAAIGLFLIIVDVPIVAKTIKLIHGHTCTRKRNKDRNEN